MNPTPETAGKLDRAQGALIALARARGFDALGVSDVALDVDAAHLERWLGKGSHGEMDYMSKHGTRRTRPAELVPGHGARVVGAHELLAGRCARRRRGAGGCGTRATCRVTRWAATITRSCATRCRAWPTTSSEQIGAMGYRVFVDSGPVLEKALARNAGLGWIGKHTNLIARDAGSYFFIGEILTDLPLPVDEPASAHCGTCSACIPVCPTGAITAPQQLDARRCISYLTIELHGAIPVELRRMLGNRIYGCDDCQLVCPWNKFARAAAHPDFKTRHRLDASRLSELFAWTEAEFLDAHRGLGDPPHRLRTLAAQHRRGARQCAGDRGKRRLRCAARRDDAFSAGARTRGTGRWDEQARRGARAG